MKNALFITTRNSCLVKDGERVLVRVDREGLIPSRRPVETGTPLRYKWRLIRREAQYET